MDPVYMSFLDRARLQKMNDKSSKSKTGSGSSTPSGSNKKTPLSAAAVKQISARFLAMARQQQAVAQARAQAMDLVAAGLNPHHPLPHPPQQPFLPVAPNQMNHLTGALDGVNGASNPRLIQQLLIQQQLQQQQQQQQQQAIAVALAQQQQQQQQQKKRILLEPVPIQGDVAVCAPGCLSRFLLAWGVTDLKQLASQFGAFGSIKISLVFPSEGTCALIEYSSVNEAVAAQKSIINFVVQFAAHPLKITPRKNKKFVDNNAPNSNFSSRSSSLRSSLMSSLASSSNSSPQSSQMPNKNGAALFQPVGNTNNKLHPSSAVNYSQFSSLPPTCLDSSSSSSSTTTSPSAISKQQYQKKQVGRGGRSLIITSGDNIHRPGLRTGNLFAVGTGVDSCAVSDYSSSSSSVASNSNDSSPELTGHHGPTLSSSATFPGIGLLEPRTQSNSISSISSQSSQLPSSVSSSRPESPIPSVSPSILSTKPPSPFSQNSTPLFPNASSSLSASGSSDTVGEGALYSHFAYPSPFASTGAVSRVFSNDHNSSTSSNNDWVKSSALIQRLGAAASGVSCSSSSSPSAGLSSCSSSSSAISEFASMHGHPAVEIDDDQVIDDVIPLSSPDAPFLAPKPSPTSERGIGFGDDMHDFASFLPASLTAELGGESSLSSSSNRRLSDLSASSAYHSPAKRPMQRAVTPPSQSKNNLHSAPSSSGPHRNPLGPGLLADASPVHDARNQKKTNNNHNKKNSKNVRRTLIRRGSGSSNGINSSSRFAVGPDAADSVGFGSRGRGQPIPNHKVEVSQRMMPLGTQKSAFKGWNMNLLSPQTQTMSSVISNNGNNIPSVSLSHSLPPRHPVVASSSSTSDLAVDIGSVSLD